MRSSTILKEIFLDEGIHLVIHLDPVVINDEKANELKALVEGLLF